MEQVEPFFEQMRIARNALLFVNFKKLYLRVRLFFLN